MQSAWLTAHTAIHTPPPPPEFPNSHQSKQDYIFFLETSRLATSPLQGEG